MLNVTCPRTSVVWMPRAGYNIEVWQCDAAGNRLVLPAPVDDRNAEVDLIWRSGGVCHTFLPGSSANRCYFGLVDSSNPTDSGDARVT